jgi:type IV secretory pathway protease TraF
MRRRLKTILLMLAATVLISLPIFETPDPVLLWNASASAPVGLYRVRSIEKLGAPELVVARPPARLADLLDEGGYLPRGVPLIKHVLGLAGQTICRADLTVTVDEITKGSARERDHLGRKLPTWQGCHKLADSEVFLMNQPTARLQELCAPVDSSLCNL